MLTCGEFRARLSVLLSGQRAAPEWAALAWHEHLHTCSECRDLLEAEEALEVLLETLPEPRLPRALCQRVLDRLAADRSVAAVDAGDTVLDDLLGLAEVAHPEDLAGTVLRGLRDSRGAARETRTLDDLLERLPAPSTPAGLADRMLEGLESQRERRPVLRRVPVGDGGGGAWLRGPVRWAVAAGVLLSVALGIWRSALRPDAGESPPLELARGDREGTQHAEDTGVVLDGPGGKPTADPAADPTWEEPSEELLASLDLLESWEYLTGDDVDQVLASLDTLDELSLYLADEELGG